MSRDGIATEKDDAVAFNWFSKGARQGSAACHLAMGDCYRDGRGTVMDVQLAAASYRLAVQGDDGDVYNVITKSTSVGPAARDIEFPCGKSDELARKPEWMACSATFLDVSSKDSEP